MSNSVKIKAFNMRMSRDLWLFLKKMAAENETSMNSYILSMLLKSKERHEKKELTHNDTTV